MAKFVVFFVAALAFHAALAAPKKNQGGAPKSQIEEVASQVQVVVNDVSATLQKVLPDEKQISDALVSNSQQFVKGVEDIVKKLQDELDKNKGTSDNLLQQVTGELTANIKALKQAIGPDATAKANEIRTALDNQFKSSAVQIEKLVELVKPNVEQAGATLNTFGQGILNDFLKTAEDLKLSIDSTVQGGAKKSKN